MIPQIQTLDNLYLAFWKAQRGHRKSAEVEAFRQQLDQELFDLQSQLQSGKLNVGNYRYFYVYDPKERLICACSFSEKVLHHALMNVCHDTFDRYQIHDSYACRLGKGTHKAVERAAYFSARYPYFAKLDVRKYFETMPHTVLKAQLARGFKEKQLHNYFDQIIDSYQTAPERGLPIGNLTSQYFANHFLGQADHFVKEKLRVRPYVRYMDDMILWGGDKKTLRKQSLALKDYLEHSLSVEVKPIIMNRVCYGLPFLGYQLKSNGIRLHRRSKQRFRRKAKAVQIAWHKGALTDQAAASRMQALQAMTEHAKGSEKFRKVCTFVI